MMPIMKIMTVIATTTMMITVMIIMVMMTMIIMVMMTMIIMVMMTMRRSGYVKEEEAKNNNNKGTFVSLPANLHTPRYFLCSPLSANARSSVINPVRLMNKIYKE